MEKSAILPCFRAEIFGWSIPRAAAASLCVIRRRWISAIIFAASLAFANRSSASGSLKRETLRERYYKELRPNLPAHEDRCDLTLELWLASWPP